MVAGTAGQQPSAWLMSHSALDDLLPDPACHSCRVIKVTLDNGEVLVGMNLLREDMALLKKSLIDKPINGPSPAVPAP